jgi:site-specific recombinase XerD
MNAATLPALIQRFFTDRLCIQMEASSHTVAGYRDTFRLLLRFASVRHGKPPIKLTVEDIDVDVVADFLVHGETARGNSARSRNTRLAAIRSFFRYVAMTDPAWLLHCQRILAMPNKRYVKRAVTFLDAEEIAALLAAPDRSTWAGRRDHALLLLAIQTGLRASELMNLRCGDVALGSGAHIRCMGKGRKERCTPLRRDTAKLLAAWIGKPFGQQQAAVPVDPGRAAQPRRARTSSPQALPHGIARVPEPHREAGHTTHASPLSTLPDYVL